MVRVRRNSPNSKPMGRRSWRKLNEQSLASGKSSECSKETLLFFHLLFVMCVTYLVMITCIYMW